MSPNWREKKKKKGKKREYIDHGIPIAQYQLVH
jgi:hypothetical protein